MYKKYTLMHNDDAVAHVWFDPVFRVSWFGYSDL